MTTTSLLNKTSELLGIKRDWLEGASGCVYPTYDFYKQPKLFHNFLANKLSSGNEFSAVLLSPNKEDIRNISLLIIQETIGELDGKPFHRYYLCNNWVHSYWKSRAYLTSVVAHCWKNSVYVFGLKTSNELIESITWGQALLDFKDEGIYRIRGEHWHVEDMALDPLHYLRDIKPEKNNFGHTSALTLWLELRKAGLMDCGIYNPDTEIVFRNKLKDLTVQEGSDKV